GRVPPRSAGSTGRGSRFEPRRDGVAHHRVVQPVRPARNPTPPGRGRVARGALAVSRGSGAEGRGLACLAALRAPRRSLGGVLGVPARLPGRLRTPGPAACRLPDRRGSAERPACPAGTVWQGLGATGGCTSCSAVTRPGRRPRYRTTPAGTALVNLEQLLPD